MFTVNSERVYMTASAIVAASDGIPTESAILIALKIVELSVELENLKNEIQAHIDN